MIKKHKSLLSPFIVILLTSSTLFPWAVQIENATQKPTKFFAWMDAKPNPYTEVIQPGQIKTIQTSGYCPDGMSAGPQNMNYYTNIDDMVTALGIAGASTASVGGILMAGAALAHTAAKQSKANQKFIQAAEKVKNKYQQQLQKLKTVRHNIEPTLKTKIKKLDIAINRAKQGDISYLKKIASTQVDNSTLKILVQEKKTAENIWLKQQNEVAKLNQALKEQKKIVEKLNQELEKSKIHSNKINTAKNNVAIAEKRYRALQKNIKNFRKQMQSTERKIVRQNTKIKNLSKQIDEIKNGFEYFHLKRKMDLYGNQAGFKGKRTLQKKIKELKGNMPKEMSNLEIKMRQTESLGYQINDIENQMVLITEEIENINKPKKYAAPEKIKEMQKNIGDLYNERLALQKRKSRAIDFQKTLKKNLDSKIMTQDDYTRLIAQSNETIKTNTQNLNKLNRKISAAHKNLNSVTSDQSAKKWKTLEWQQKQIKIKEDKIKTLQKKLDSLSDQHTKLHSEVGESLVAQEAKMTQFTDDISKIKKEIIPELHSTKKSLVHKTTAGENRIVFVEKELRKTEQALDELAESSKFADDISKKLSSSKEAVEKIQKNLTKVNLAEEATEKTVKNISENISELTTQKSSEKATKKLAKEASEEIDEIIKKAPKKSIKKALAVAGVALVVVGVSAYLIYQAAKNNYYIAPAYYNYLWESPECWDHKYVWTGNKVSDGEKNLTQEQQKQESLKGLTWGKLRYELTNTANHTIDASFGFAGGGAQHKRVLPGHKFVVRSDKGLKNISINQNGQFTDKQVGNIQQSTTITWTNEGFGQLGVQSGVTKRKQKRRRRF